MKKVWSQPSLEMLEISKTMAGVGSSYIDFVGYDNGVPDFDISDDPSGTPIVQS